MTQVKIDEVLCLMCDVAAKISAHDTMPGRIIFLVKFLLDIGSNIFLYVILLHSLCGAVNSILLHVLRHVCILDYCLPVRHRDTSPRRVRPGPGVGGGCGERREGPRQGRRQGRSFSLSQLPQAPAAPLPPRRRGPRGVRAAAAGELPRPSAPLLLAPRRPACSASASASQLSLSFQLRFALPLR